jgi:membrane protein DedA with SNARE-associated domain/Arc/MetJ family transcription regulator
LRTTIDIDKDLLEIALRESGLSSKGAVIEEGLRLLIQREARKRLLAASENTLGTAISQSSAVPGDASDCCDRRSRMTSRFLGLAAALLLVLLTGQPEAAAQTGEQGETRLHEAEQMVGSEAEAAVARVRPLLERYGYPAIFVAVGVEGMGIPAPGQTLLIAASIDAAHGGLNIAAVVALAVLAAALGNSIGYLIGRVGGRPLLRKLPISEARLARVDALFRRHGGWFILVARFFDGTRQLNGIMAGTLEMPWWRFTFWNLLGAVLFVAVWGLGTYWLDRDIGQVMAILRRIEPLAIALLVAALVAGLVYLWRRRRHGTGNGGREG